MCITINQPETKSNPNSNFTTKQHVVLSIQRNIVAYFTYQGQFIRENVVALFYCFLLSVALCLRLPVYVSATILLMYHSSMSLLTHFVLMTILNCLRMLRRKQTGLMSIPESAAKLYSENCCRCHLSYMNFYSIFGQIVISIRVKHVTEAFCVHAIRMRYFTMIFVRRSDSLLRYYTSVANAHFAIYFVDISTQT